MIVSCGEAKGPVPASALWLYTGSYFDQLRRYARLLASDDRIYVLSARHGLVRARQVIAPYDQKMGRPGAVTPAQVRAQAQVLGLRFERVVIGLVSEDAGYADLLRIALPQVKLPMAGLPKGIIGRKQWLARRTREAMRS